MSGINSICHVLDAIHHGIMAAQNAMRELIVLRRSGTYDRDSHGAEEWSFLEGQIEALTALREQIIGQD